MERAFESVASDAEAVARFGCAARAKRGAHGDRPRAAPLLPDAATRPSRGAAAAIAIGAARTCGRAHDRPRAFESARRHTPSTRIFLHVFDRAPFGSAHLPRGLHAQTAAAYLYSCRCQDSGALQRADSMRQAATSARAAQQRGERRT
jgi:hypothetical protein